MRVVLHLYIHVHTCSHIGLKYVHTHTSAAHARVLDLNHSYYLALKIRKITEKSVRLVAMLISHTRYTGTTRAGMDIGSRYIRGGPAGRARDYLIIRYTILACAGRQSAHPYFR